MMLLPLDDLETTAKILKLDLEAGELFRLAEEHNFNQEQ